jgi:hypothetical protein
MLEIEEEESRKKKFVRLIGVRRLRPPRFASMLAMPDEAKELRNRAEGIFSRRGQPSLMVNDYQRLEDNYKAFGLNQRC